MAVVLAGGLAECGVDATHRLDQVEDPSLVRALTGHVEGQGEIQAHRVRLVGDGRRFCPGPVFHAAGEGGHEVVALGGGGDLLERLAQQDRRRTGPFAERVLLHTVTCRYALTVVPCDAPDLSLLEGTPAPYSGRQSILAARAGGVTNECLFDKSGHAGQSVHGLQIVDGGGLERSSGLLLSWVEV
ncbi:hypothetical protein OOK43_02270 [[Kitasatospora] papulosa]|uniref:hypothetical protein n=1 Tax=[Kitasatospora] papulosa TaxID=1464011 RepID=UPI00224F88FA|nr:hypothetical protein [[Kitasatospora] papulosa]MCX4412108.1 hypothetical protein [[Kitasatospora] papulosa]